MPTFSERQSYFSNRETTNCVGLLEETTNTHSVHIGGRRLVTVRKNHLVLSSKWRRGSSPYSLGQLQSSSSGSDRPEKCPRDYEDGGRWATRCSRPPRAALRLSARTVTQVTRVPRLTLWAQVPTSCLQALSVLLGITSCVNCLVLNPRLRGCFWGDHN